jgi:hypothetical protein
MAFRRDCPSAGTNVLSVAVKNDENPVSRRAYSALMLARRIRGRVNEKGGR